MLITQSQLKSLLHYNQDTGLFTWLNNIKHHGKTKGKIAGYTNPLGYTLISIKGKTYHAHRLAWLYIYGEIPNIIDHIDHNPTNNKIDNLRNTDTRGNMKNCSMNIKNTSGFTGVHFDKQYGKWRAMIRVNSKKVSLYSGNSKEDAIIARKKANIKYGYHKNHGE